jgi:uncharacterized membrane protein HdeD (DUF308 family)
MTQKERNAWIVASAFGLIGAVLGFVLLSQTYGASPFIGAAVLFLVVGARAYRKSMRE